KVRKELGYPPLVTPTSQIVGTQSVLNVIMGERYKMVTNEVKNYLRGQYGRPPADIDEDFRHKIIGDSDVIDARPADFSDPALHEYRQEIKQYIEQDEDILSYALFPQVAMKYFEFRQAGKYKLDSTLID